MFIRYWILLALCLSFGQNLVAKTYEYDDGDRLIKVTYANGKVIRYTYDDHNNLIRTRLTEVLSAVENFIVVQGADGNATTPQSVLVSWDYGSALGASFLLQTRIAGTDMWETAASIPITERSFEYEFPFGEEREFRMTVVGANPEDESSPTAAVEVLPSSVLVTTLLDEDDLKLGLGQGDSLREAIRIVGPGGVIEFAPDLSGDTIPLTHGQLVIDKKLTIDASSLPDGILLDARAQSRAMLVSTEFAVTLKKLNFRNGSADSGAGVQNLDALLTIFECTFSNNSAHDYGGAIFNGGDGKLFVERCEISGNQALYGGGVLSGTGATTAEILNTKITGNTATAGGGGVYHSGVSLKIERSSINGNGANTGGAVSQFGGSCVILNSTLNGNGAQFGGAIHNDGGGYVEVNHGTITGNVSGGITNVAPSRLLLENSIVANNSDPSNERLDITGDINEAWGANIVRVLDGSVIFGPAVLAVDPLLSSPRTDGTQAPLIGSPAIDAAVVSAFSPDTDQQKQPRPFAGGPDLGAIEVRLKADTSLDWITTNAGPLSPRFDTDEVNYTVLVLDSVSTAAVRASKGHNQQTLEVRSNGGAFAVLNNEAASPDFPLNLGVNVIDLKVTSQSGTATQIYSITIYRGLELDISAELASLSLGTLSPSFSPEIDFYHTPVANLTSLVSLVATAKNPAAQIELRSNLGDYVPLTGGQTSPDIPLQVGANRIDLRVTSETGNNAKIYSVVVYRDSPAGSDATLFSLTTSEGTLTPVFSRGRLVYAMPLSDATSTLQVTPTASNPGATLRIRANDSAYVSTSTGVASAPVTLLDGRNRIDIEVTSPDAFTSQTYSILIDRVIDRIVNVPADGNDLALSADGRLLVFSSTDSGLVPGDTNGETDIFVYDLVAETMQRVSVDVNGVQGDKDSDNPSISADGRFVVFQSEAKNLVPNDNNGNSSTSRGRDIFVYDLLNSTIERISMGYDGNEANQKSNDPSISGDGRYVAFSSSANNMVDDFNGSGEVNVYVHDRDLNVTIGVPVPFADTQTNRASLHPVISADGRFVAFEFNVSSTSSSNSEVYRFQDIYLFNRETLAVERISGFKLGIEARDIDSSNPAISADGRFIAFDSNYEDIDFYDTNRQDDVFLYDRETGITKRSSTAYDQVDALFYSSIIPAISGDGQTVAFESRSSKIVPGDTNVSSDVFTLDRGSDVMRRISVNESGVEGDDTSDGVAISGDGRTVAFVSDATNLVPTVTGEIYAVVTDPLPVSVNNDLLSLVSTFGRFHQPFSPERTFYHVVIPNEITSGRLSLVAVDPDATVRIYNGSAYEEVGPDGEFQLALHPGVNSVFILVTAADGSTFKIYTINLARPLPPYVPGNNALLTSLQTSSGNLLPDFDPDTVQYDVTFPANVTSVALTPVVQDSLATIEVFDDPLASGSTSSPVNLEIGENTLYCTVTAEDGVTQRTYTVIVTRSPFPFNGLTNLVLDTGPFTSVFSTGDYFYEAIVANEVQAVSLTPSCDPLLGTVTINGEAVASGAASTPIDFEGDFLSIIQVVASSLDGTESSTYTVAVYREVVPPSSDANLVDLTISTGALLPIFDPDTQSYQGEVPHNVSEIIVTPVLSDNLASLTINGAFAISDFPSTPIPLSIGANQIVIAVQAEDGTEKIYQVNVTRSRFKVTEVSFQNLEETSVQLSWQSELGKTYVIQASSDLENWIQFGGSVAGTGESTSTVIDLSTAGFTGSVFFRVGVTN